MVVLPRSESGRDRKVELVPLNSLNFEQRTQILDMALKTKDMDNELFLRKVRTRLDRCNCPHTLYMSSLTDKFILRQALPSVRPC